MMLKTVILLKCLVITLDDRISVEEESDEQFFALRERRSSETTKSANINNTDDGTGSSGSGIDDCFTNIKCINNSRCVEVDGKNICQCKKGYSGDGNTCNDIDECDVHPEICSVNAACNNTVGSFICSCNDRFYGDGKTCNDIDECDVHPEICSVNATCNNTVGSFICYCNDRFYGNGRTCSEINTEYSSKNVYTKPGKVAILVCTLNEIIIWKKDGNRIQNDEKKKAFQNILVIDPEDEDDFGEYFCEVEAYEGFGIKINLIIVENNGPESSNGNLIPLVILAILLFVAILVIVYLIWSRKARPRANETTYTDDYGNDNALYEMPKATSSKVVPDEENIYSDLSDEREQEPIYQGLMDNKNEAADTGGDDYSNTQGPNLYEPLDLNLTSKA